MTARPTDRPEKGQGSKSRKARIHELESQVEEYRRLLGMDTPLDITLWEQVNSQEMRDAMATRALIQEWGDPYKALRRLGFDFEVTPKGAIGKEDREEVRDLIKRIFQTEGVKALSTKAFEDIESIKTEMLSRQAQIALHGDDESSVRAFSQVSKTLGWQKQDAPPQNVPVINLYNMVAGNAPPQVRATVGEPQAIQPAPGFLDHEPGDPVRIDSGDETVYEALGDK